jgi:hypothetical protein
VTVAPSFFVVHPTQTNTIDDSTRSNTNHHKQINKIAILFHGAMASTVLYSVQRISIFLPIMMDSILLLSQV